MQTTENDSLHTLKGVVSAAALIRAEFPGVSMADFKALTETDRIQLASGIASKRGLTPEQLVFTPVAY